MVGNYQISQNEGIMLENSPASIEANKRFLAVCMIGKFTSFSMVKIKHFILTLKLPAVGLGTFSMFTISLLIPAGKSMQNNVKF